MSEGDSKETSRSTEGAERSWCLKRKTDAEMMLKSLTVGERGDFVGRGFCLFSIVLLELLQEGV